MVVMVAVVVVRLLCVFNDDFVYIYDDEVVALAVVVVVVVAVVGVCVCVRACWAGTDRHTVTA